MVAEDNNSFLRELVERANAAKSFQVFYKYYKGQITKDSDPGSFQDIFGIKDDILSPTALSSLDVYENRPDKSDELIAWKDLKWKLAAFISIQDVFDTPLLQFESPLSMFYLWYFYYESKYILLELLLCGLNGFYLASDTLLRTFMEFNIRQCYYYRKVHEEGSYKPLEDFFERSIPPKLSTTIKGALPSHKFSRPINKRITMHLTALSQSAIHPYHPDYSHRQHTVQLPGPSLEGVFFWHGARIIVQSVLWVYYANFPMLFQPVDILPKFGFSPPVGIFVDENCASIIRCSLTEKEYAEFKEYSDNDSIVSGYIDWYNDRPDLNADQIKDTWNGKEDGELESFLLGKIKTIVKMRAIKEGFALRSVKDSDPDITLKDYLNIFSYDKWKQLYKKLP